MFRLFYNIISVSTHFPNYNDVLWKMWCEFFDNNLKRKHNPIPFFLQTYCVHEVHGDKLSSIMQFIIRQNTPSFAIQFQ